MEKIPKNFTMWFMDDPKRIMLLYIELIFSIITLKTSRKPRRGNNA